LFGRYEYAVLIHKRRRSNFESGQWSPVHGTCAHGRAKLRHSVVAKETYDMENCFGTVKAVAAAYTQADTNRKILSPITSNDVETELFVKFQQKRTQSFRQ
jgi:hypothetical protein